MRIVQEFGHWNCQQYRKRGEQQGKNSHRTSLMTLVSQPLPRLLSLCVASC